MPHDLIKNGSFENGNLHWEFSQYGASVSSSLPAGFGPVPDGSRFGRIQGNKTAIGINYDGSMFQPCKFIQGVQYEPSIHIAGDASYNPIEVYVNRISDGQTIFYDTYGPNSTKQWWNESFGVWVPDETFWGNFILRVSRPAVNGYNLYLVDLVSCLYPTDNELLMKSTVPDFMTKLGDLIAALDVNIGKVYTEQKRWKTTTEIQDDDAWFTIQATGTIDDMVRVGQNVIRFWIMEPWVEPEPLTNCSSQYRNRIVLTGFYQYESEVNQETILREAAIEIIDALNTKSNELTTLNTGDGYLGFLTFRPRMLSPVKNARLGEGQNIIQGHAVQIEINFFEEVIH